MTTMAPGSDRPARASSGTGAAGEKFARASIIMDVAGIVMIPVGVIQGDVNPYTFGGVELGLYIVAGALVVGAVVAAYLAGRLLPAGHSRHHFAASVRQLTWVCLVLVLPFVAYLIYIQATTTSQDLGWASTLGA